MFCNWWHQEFYSSNTRNPAISRFLLSRVSTNRRQPIVFWFRYLRISFWPIAVFQLSWVCVLAWTITSHLRALWCFSCTVFNGPKRKVMDNVSCTKRQRKVLMFGENIELLHWSAWRENVVSVRSTITGSMIVGRTFLIVLFFIRKPSFSFKPHYPSNLIPKHSFSNSVFEPYFQTLHFWLPDSNPHSQTHILMCSSWNKFRWRDLEWNRFLALMIQKTMSSRILVLKQGRSWFKVMRLRIVLPFSIVAMLQAPLS